MKKIGLADAVNVKTNRRAEDTMDRFGESLFDFKDLRDVEKWWETQGAEQSWQAG